MDPRLTLSEFDVLRSISRGCFGEVFEAEHRATGARYALKRVPVPRTAEGLPSAVCREIAAMRRLAGARHVTQLYECFAHGGAVVLVMELCASDLSAWLRARSPLDPHSAADKRCVLEMMFLALDECHAAGVLHRDVKPGNFLISACGQLKLSDFGLARPARLVRADEDRFTHEVATRWYRAPELLLGADRYGAEIDMWAAGCIALEILCSYHAAVFQGAGDIDQLNTIFAVLGTPTEENWPGLPALPDWGKIEFLPKPGMGIAQAFPELTPTARDLVERLLCLNPRARLTAAEVLVHPFFLASPPLASRDDTGLGTSSRPPESTAAGAESPGSLLAASERDAAVEPL